MCILAIDETPSSSRSRLTPQQKMAAYRARIRCNPTKCLEIKAADRKRKRESRNKTKIDLASKSKSEIKKLKKIIRKKETERKREQRWKKRPQVNERMQACQARHLRCTAANKLLERP